MQSNLRNLWRTLISDKQSSILNITGLSIGLTCTILIFLWVKDELGMDKFNELDKQLFQVKKTVIESDGMIDVSDHTPGQMAARMKADFPEIEKAASVVIEREKGLVGIEDKFIRTSPRYAGTDFFSIFSYPVIDGNRKDLLREENSVVISEKLAISLFNTTKDLRGKIVEWKAGPKISGSYTISGVFRIPDNASEQFDLVFSYDHYYKTFKDNYGLGRWDSNNPATYLLLKNNTNIAAFNAKIKDYTKNIMVAAYGKDILKWEGDVFVQKYSDRYLYNQFENGKQSGGRINYVKLFSLVAILILLIACINFMNLATAKASAAIRQSAIRKLIGASRISLIGKFIFESVSIALVALLLAFVFVAILLPKFNQLTGKELEMIFSGNTVAWLLLISLATGLLAGLYPAIFLSSFKPAIAIKGRQLSGGHAGFRKVLVVAQFCTSIVFIIAVIVVYRQMDLIQQKSLGFEKDNVIRFTTEGNVKEQLSTFLTELRKIPGVKQASAMDGDFTGSHSGGGGIDWKGKITALEFDGFYVNTNWMETFGIDVIEGRNFREGYDSSNAVLFNETAIRMMGLKNPIGTEVKMWGRTCNIIGVVRDFHYESLYHRPGPFFIRYEAQNDFVVARLDKNSVAPAIERIRSMYSGFNKGVAFEYEFLDDDFSKLYAAEQRVATLSSWFAAVTILISCLGLFGLASFTAQKRKKEIGLRKVLGASVQGITMMLTRSFMQLVLIALLIAFPLAWWLMHNWLADFQYRVKVGADIFVYTAIIAIAITIITICFQSIRAALANPTASLRSE